MKRPFMKVAVGCIVALMGMGNIAAAANVGVGVDISTPNVRVQVGNQAPQPPKVTVVERERVIVRETEVYHDRGKHKGHGKKHKKHKKHD